MKEQIFYHYNHVLVKEVSDFSIGLKGYFVIDTEINGLSCGGLRIMPTISLQEIRDLARAMSLKQGLVGLPRGGARAGIIGDIDMPFQQKQILVNRFCEFIIEHIRGRRCLIGPDVGTDANLIYNMYQYLGIAVPKPSKSSANSGKYTSFSVYHSLILGLKLQSKIIKGSKIAIEGFGRVGKPLAIRLYHNGADIVGISNLFGGIYAAHGIDIPKLINFIARNGDAAIQQFPETEAISKLELLKLELDALCPCATDATIHSANCEYIAAPLICAGANNPVTAAADDILFRKSQIYFPDFISNCGGVLGNAIEFAGLSEDHIVRCIQDDLMPILMQLHEASQKQNKSMSKIGISLVDKKIKAAQNPQKSGVIVDAILNFGLHFYRKGWIPAKLIRNFAYRKIRSNLGRNLFTNIFDK